MRLGDFEIMSLGEDFHWRRGHNHFTAFWFVRGSYNKTGNIAVLNQFIKNFHRQFRSAEKYEINT